MLKTKTNPTNNVIAQSEMSLASHPFPSAKPTTTQPKDFNNNNNENENNDESTLPENIEEVGRKNQNKDNQS